MDQIRATKSLFNASPTTNSQRRERLSRLDSGFPNVPKDRTGIQTESYISRRGCKQSYEEALATNERLRTRLEASMEELAIVETKLKRVEDQQLKRRSTDRISGILETEKQEKKSLEKKISDMEEKLKTKADLTKENQRLKDENAALIRVISKLSK